LVSVNSNFSQMLRLVGQIICVRRKERS